MRVTCIALCFVVNILLIEGNLERNPEEGDWFEGDIVFSQDISEATKVSFETYSYDWNDTSFYNVSKRRKIPTVQTDENQSIMFEAAVNEFHALTNVRWIPKTSKHKDYVLFVKGEGCSSMVGRQGGMQLVTTADDCYIYLGVLLHEMMHVIGFWHEHSRWDRDYYIKVKSENILPGYEDNFVRQHPGNHELFAPFDYDSIMLYVPTAFAKDYTKRTIDAFGDPSLNGRMGQRGSFSLYDVYKINMVYRCRFCIDKPWFRSVSLPFHCDFYHGFCQFYYTDNYGSWNRTLGSRSDPRIPSHDHTTGRDVYAFIDSGVSELNSPFFTVNGLVCVKFWYHVIGDGTESVSLLLVKYHNLFSRSEENTFLWQNRPTGSNEWHFGAVEFNAYGSTRIAFQGTSYPYTSKAAIDDVDIVQEPCWNNAGVSLPFACNFSTDNCGLILHNYWDRINATYSLKDDCLGIDLYDDFQGDAILPLKNSSIGTFLSFNYQIQGLADLANVSTLKVLYLHYGQEFILASINKGERYIWHNFTVNISDSIEAIIFRAGYSLLDED